MADPIIAAAMLYELGCLVFLALAACHMHANRNRKG